MQPGHISHRTMLHGLEIQLQQFIQHEEEHYHTKSIELTDSLWSHSIRVAALAEKIGLQEGIDPTACRLAGLFHDAGKFFNGAYRSGTVIEEDGSVRVLYKIVEGKGIRQELVDQVAEAILDMYSEDRQLSLLGKILFDADNLDKLGLSGVGNFLIKAGLRGRGLNHSLLYRTGVELTYARYAPETMMTQTGRELAAEKAPQTIDFYHRLLDSLKDDGLFDFNIVEVPYQGVILDIVEPSLCTCGGQTDRRIWAVADLKCRKIHVRHRCNCCDYVHKLEFCRPRLPLHK